MNPESEFDTLELAISPELASLIAHYLDQHPDCSLADFCTRAIAYYLAHATGSVFASHIALNRLLQES